MELFDWYDFYNEVLDKAVKLGYSKQQVAMFEADIKYHYDSGMTVDEIIDIEF